MARDTVHELQPRTDHDGLSRRLAVLACKQAIRSSLEPGLKQEFESSGEPPLEQLDTYPAWASLNRAAQDRMWRVLAEQVDQDYPRIREAATQITDRDSCTLDLDAGNPPAYMCTAHIHGQPGGYLLDRDANDLAAGVLYEAGGNLYALGQGIGQKDSKGQRLIKHLREQMEGFSPRRILEMGCSAGGQTADYPAAFPTAEVHAIDVSAGMLRYARARTEALSQTAHFHLADAASTPWPDEHFDLIISHNMFHEVDGGHMGAIMAECFRLLAPGGLVVHQDVPIQVDRLDDWMKALSTWQKDNNDEPFWEDFSNADLPALMANAGFPDDQISEEYLRALDGPIPWYVISARKPN